MYPGMKYRFALAILSRRSRPTKSGRGEGGKHSEKNGFFASEKPIIGQFYKAESAIIKLI